MKNLFILVLLATINLFSQQNDIIGFVIDKVTKEPLLGVNLILLGTDYGASSNENGVFTIQNIPVGVYKIKASYVGYKSIVKTDVIVTSVKPTELNFELMSQSVEIEGVTISSNYFEEDPSEIGSISSFSYEEIRRTPGGFEDVVRGLSVLPGIAKQSGGRNDLVVRGGAPTENLYLIDGLVVPNINHFSTQGATGGTNSFIDLDYIQNTTFSSGGFSVKYGDKLSSVLGLELRNPRKDKIGGKALISATQFGLNVEGPLSKNSDFLFSIRRSYLDFIFKAAKFNFIPEYYDMLAKYNLRISQTEKFEVLFIGALDRVNFVNDDLEDQIDNSRILGNDQNIYTFGVNYQNLFNGGFYSIGFNRSYTSFDAFQNDFNLNPIFLNDSKESQNSLQFNLVRKINKKSEINFGASYTLVRAINEVKLPENFVTTFGDVLPSTNINIENYYSKADMYLLYNSRFFNNLSLNIGVRGDYFDGINQKFTISPRGSLSYEFSNLTKVNFSTGIYFQSPSYLWLIYKNNESLKPIRVNQFVLGLEHFITSSTKVKGEVFYKDYSNYPTSKLRNYLILANTGSGFGGAETNFNSFGLEPLSSVGVGNTEGIEISIQKKASEDNVYGIGSLTFSKSEFTGLDEVVRTGQYNQSIIFNLSGGYIWEDWIFSFKFRYATGMPYTKYNSDGTQDLENYLASNLPTSNALDLRVDRRWNFESIYLITYLDIQNIYNKRNISGYRFDYYENKIVEQKEFGILPTIGVSIEF